MGRILVADDQAELAELIQAVLESEGYVVEAVDSGQAALDRLAAQGSDLVICDLQIPTLMGSQSTARWTSSPLRGRPCCS